MDHSTTIDLRWGDDYEAKTDDHWGQHHRPQKIHQQSDDEAARKTKLEKRQAAYQAKQKRKLERIKERYRTDPVFRAKRLEVSREANKRRYHSAPEYRQRVLERGRTAKRRCSTPEGTPVPIDHALVIPSE
ncbi:hypothetical protein [Gellertiella hungarica]|uniref:Uncharacterized protein n=1 Tax=Gellertiella hungarica TaxID=1572859 RepID=A0A7W6J5E2_9HYPH|nr:hypothetical protein [Gellertiella hungarica]MBB4064233.1 hypothetical protein [Gellertiella hungarica]